MRIRGLHGLTAMMRLAITLFNVTGLEHDNKCHKHNWLYCTGPWHGIHEMRARCAPVQPRALCKIARPTSTSQMTSDMIAVATSSNAGTAHHEETGPLSLA